MIPSVDIKEVVTIISDFITTYVQQSKTKGVIIGLSGGIDSAVAAILCQQCLGTKRMKCLFLPEKTTPALDIKHVKTLEKRYALSVLNKDISSLVQAAEDNCVVKPDAIALSNIKARLRMILLYEHANMTNRLVCGTSNKSELLIGYFTKYGDGGSDILPLGDVYKTHIYQIAEYLKISSEIIKKSPCAGLQNDQTDEADIGLCYETLDSILYGLERMQSIETIATQAQVSTKEVLRIQQMRKNSQHKRRRPLIPKIGLRTPGIDWRSPVQEG